LGKITKDEPMCENYFLGPSQQVRRNARRNRMIQLKEQAWRPRELDSNIHQGCDLKEPLMLTNP
jgi:hypothetical protein